MALIAYLFLAYQKFMSKIGTSLHYLARQGALKKFKIPGFIRACGVRESDLNALIRGAA